MIFLTIRSKFEPMSTAGCLLLALFGPDWLGSRCPFLRVKQTPLLRASMSESDPTETFGTREKLTIYSIGGMVRTQAMMALRSRSVILLK